MIPLEEHLRLEEKEIDELISLGSTIKKIPGDPWQVSLKTDKSVSRYREILKDKPGKLMCCLALSPNVTDYCDIIKEFGSNLPELTAKEFLDKVCTKSIRNSQNIVVNRKKGRGWIYCFVSDSLENEAREAESEEIEYQEGDTVDEEGVHLPPDIAKGSNC